MEAEARTDGELPSGSHAGVTTCVYLSWVSSRASGGPSPSSAGSVTEPSVSCCHLSTFRTCTVCGKLLLVGWWLQDRPALSAGLCSPCSMRRCAQGIEQGPLSSWRLRWSVCSEATESIVQSSMGSREPALPEQRDLFMLRVLVSDLCSIIKA